MDETLVRTSVTVDEAVAILLGWVRGPIRYTSPDQLSKEEQEDLDNARFSLADEMEDRQCSCESDLEEAKDNGLKDDDLKDDVTEEKAKAIKKHTEFVRLANFYLCAINDEINKGEQSGLRIDRELSNSMCAYVTLTSLDQWANARYGKQILKQPESPILATVVQNKAPKVPRTRMADQQGAILLEIEKQGYLPMHLPKTVGSRPGVKAAVKKALAVNPLFKGKSTFKRAWDQLRKDGSIADADQL